MKLHFKSARQGSTLIMTLFFCLAIGMVLASILKLASARYTMSIRSTDWNEAIPVLEAGIEEAMTHLRDDGSPSANGWNAVTYGGQTVYQKQRTFSDGSYFVTTIYNTNAYAPVIYSQGYVRSPMKTNQFISRLVKVTTGLPPNVFTKAVATTGKITLNGNGAMVDSYDSRVGPYSATNHNANGNIATDSQVSPAVSVGSGKVYGSVITGPGGTISLAGNGAIGDATWNTTHSGVQSSTWTNNNMNVAFPSNSAPSGPFQSVPGISLLGTTLATPLSGTYSANSFTTTGTPLIITGDTVLYVSGDFKIAGTGSIIIMAGASLKLYVGGSVDIGGGGVLNNPGLASKFSIIGLSSCTSIKYSGTSSFMGTINAPQADITVSGGGDTYGAFIGKTATFSGGGSLHYDEALATTAGFIATGWKEL